MVKKPTLSLVCVYANIAKIISAFVWEELACSAMKGCRLYVVASKLQCYLLQLPNDSMKGIRHGCKIVRRSRCAN